MDLQRRRWKRKKKSCWLDQVIKNQLLILLIRHVYLMLTHYCCTTATYKNYDKDTSFFSFQSSSSKRPTDRQDDEHLAHSQLHRLAIHFYFLRSYLKLLQFGGFFGHMLPFSFLLIFAFYLESKKVIVMMMTSCCICCCLILTWYFICIVILRSHVRLYLNNGGRFTSQF